MRRKLAALVLVLALWPAGAFAADPTKGPFLLNADNVSYDTRLEVVTATGHVEISDEHRILLADEVSYNVREGIVRASGNVSLLEPNGDVIFVEYLELDDSLRTGVIRSIRILLANNARLAANGARRFENGDTEFAKAVYSPCMLCKEAPEKPPLWQIKAARVVHDAEAREVRYKDAVLEVFGVPVAYTPYFSHPDPTVKRRTGFLAPRFGSSDALGFQVETPYYIELGPSRDLTLAPIVTSKERAVMQAEYRALTSTGGYHLEGSGTYVRARDGSNNELDHDEVRGHIFAKGRFDIDEHWRWGFDGNRASDDTYLRRYNFSNTHTLTSDLYVERFERRDYFHASTVAFQGLRASDDLGLTPYVTPLIEYQTMSEPGPLNSYYTLGLSGVSLNRTEGTDTSRMSARGFWNLPYMGPIGDFYTLTAGITGDVYWMGDIGQGGVPLDDTDDGFEARVLPHVGLTWRYPFVRHGTNYRQIVEPIVQVAYAPDDGRADEIPNEDSISVEFDDSNVFELNRFPGYDRIETGLRLNYGIKASMYTGWGGYGSLLLGHVLRGSDNTDFDTNSGLVRETSDLVAALTLSPVEYLDLVTRVRLDPNDLSVRRNEVYASIGDRDYRLTGSYVFFDKDFTAALLEEREEFYVNGQARLAEHWSVIAFGRRDLTSGGRWLSAGGGVRYDDECVFVELGFERDFTGDRDVEPSSKVMVRVVLKQLN
jgi:LPS-assembly protein